MSWFNDLVSSPEKAYNAAVNIASLGTVGYKDGKLQQGALIDMTGEGLGEVTGRNLARKQMMMAQDAIREENRMREVEEQNRQAQVFRDDMAASARARALRSNSSSSDSSTTRSLLGTSTDYLGL